MVTVDKNVLVPGMMSVIVDIADDNSQRVCAADCRMSAVFYYYWQVVFLTLLAVERPPAGDDPAAVSVISTTLITIQ